MVNVTSWRAYVCMLTGLLANPLCASGANDPPAQIVESAYSNDPVRRPEDVAPPRPPVRFALPFVYDRDRAANSMREISDQVSRMILRSKTMARAIKFDAKRAEKALLAIKQHVAGMRREAVQRSRTVAGPIEGISIRHYNQIRIPTPERIDAESGLTHQELADFHLLEKGYRKTIAGWVPPDFQGQVTQRRPRRRTRTSVAQSQTDDPF